MHLSNSTLRATAEGKINAQWMKNVERLIHSLNVQSKHQTYQKKLPCCC